MNYLAKLSLLFFFCLTHCSVFCNAVLTVLSFQVKGQTLQKQIKEKKVVNAVLLVSMSEFVCSHGRSRGALGGFVCDVGQGKYNLKDPAVSIFQTSRAINEYQIKQKKWVSVELNAVQRALYKRYKRCFPTNTSRDANVNSQLDIKQLANVQLTCKYFDSFSYSASYFCCKSVGTRHFKFVFDHANHTQPKPDLFLIFSHVQANPYMLAGGPILNGNVDIVMVVDILSHLFSNGLDN